METEKRKAAIEKLNYLCTLRYSATHIKKYNLLYSLDPVTAYDLGLVKQIEVDSIVTENDFNYAFISVEKINVMKTSVSVKLKIDMNVKDGVARKTITAKVGDDLYELSNKREIYKTGYIINEINAIEDFIKLSSGQKIFKGTSTGGLEDEVIKIQIRKTIEEHLNKEIKYRNKNIKVLSLLFIDKVSNYRLYDEGGYNNKGKFALWFEEIYNEIILKDTFKDLIKFDVEKLHNGYFSQDKTGKWKDTKGNTKIDDDTFKLIMKDKERLLDVNEPLRFIFSHSALREGWDNPNVFQICTLNETQSELKKRQEIGRGLRLSVNQSGNRIFDKSINRLTVIANECYEDFAKQLQNEIEKDCGVNFSGRIKNKRNRKTVKYRKGFSLDEKFKSIWDKIKYKTRYRVRYDTQELIRNTASEIKKMPTTKTALIRYVKTNIQINKTGVSSEIKSTGLDWIKYNAVMPDILLYIQERTGLTRKSIFDILLRAGRIKDIITNPQLFLDNVISIIKSVLNDLMINGIKYEKFAGKEYEMRLFEDFDIHINSRTFKVSNKNKTIYDSLMPLDSNVEYEFAKECEQRDDIEFYFKLPFWFKITTPIGNYNPDWALVKKNEKTVYFVAETKSEGQELKISENQKIKCGHAHFREFDGVEYRKVSSVSDLD